MCCIYTIRCWSSVNFTVKKYKSSLMTSSHISSNCLLKSVHNSRVKYNCSIWYWLQIKIFCFHWLILGGTGTNTVCTQMYSLMNYSRLVFLYDARSDNSELIKRLVWHNTFVKAFVLMPLAWMILWQKCQWIHVDLHFRSKTFQFLSQVSS